MTTSLQDRYAPDGICFGCGPANPLGLQIKSEPVEREGGVELVATWQPQPHHQAFEGVLNGGIIGALLDCHSNWCACYTLMTQRKLAFPPLCVTASFAVELKRPTPIDTPVTVRARAVAVDGDRVTVESSLEGGGKVTATCRGVFVAVPEHHPAHKHWGPGRT